MKRLGEVIADTIARCSVIEADAAGPTLGEVLALEVRLNIEAAKLARAIELWEGRGAREIERGRRVLGVLNQIHQATRRGVAELRATVKP